MLKQLTYGNNRELSPNYTLTAYIFNSYFTKIVDVGETNFFRRSNSTCFNFTTIEQDSVKKKHLLMLDDVTNNDVLGFDS